MGLFSKVFNKAGRWHVKQLVQDCIKEMMNVSMEVNQQIDNPYLTDSTLDLMIEHLNTNYFDGKKYKSLAAKFNSLVTYWVQIKLGRPMDTNNDFEELMESIEKVRPYFMTTEAGVVQKLKEG